jgi:hypothetical protein
MKLPHIPIAFPPAVFSAFYICSEDILCVYIYNVTVDVDRTRCLKEADGALTGKSEEGK